MIPALLRSGSSQVYAAPAETSSQDETILNETISNNLLIKNSHSFVGANGKRPSQPLPPIIGAGSYSMDTANTNETPKSDGHIDTPINGSQSGEVAQVVRPNTIPPLLSPSGATDSTRTVSTLKREIAPEKPPVARGSFQHIRPSEAQSIYNVFKSLVNYDETNPLSRVKYCILEAEPGMGRTKGAKYFVELAEQNNISHTSVVALHGDEAIPYGVIRKLFLEFIGWDKFSSEAQQREVLTQLLTTHIRKDEHEFTLTNMKTVLGLVWIGDSPVRAAPANARIANMATVRRILIAIVDANKCCLTIDDSHFCDELSWNELEVLITSTRRVCYMLTKHTPPDVPFDRRSFEGPRSQLSPGATFDADYELKQKMLPTDAYLRLLKLPCCSRIHLRALNTKANFTELFSSVTSVEFPHGTMDTLYFASAGIPFWIHFSIRFIADNGIDKYLSIVSRSTSNHFPLLIEAELTVLKPEAQQIVLVCSIIGEGFTLDMLHNLLVDQEDLNNLSENLDFLISKRYIKAVDRNDEVAFEFEHPLLRRTIYDTIPRHEAADFHLKIALLIEQNYAADLRPYFSRLTYHYGKIQGKRSDAFKYTVKAADQAIRRGAYTDGLASAQSAARMALSALEYRVLINVLDRAQDELRSRHAVETEDNGDGDFEDPKLEAYGLLQQSLQAGLSDIIAETNHRRNDTVAVTPTSTSLPAVEAPSQVAGNTNENNDEEKENDEIVESIRPSNGGSQGGGCAACIVS